MILRPSIRQILFFILILLVNTSFTGRDISSHTHKITASKNEYTSYSYIYCHDIFREGLDTLTKTKFWRQLMRTGGDSMIFYTYPDKEIITIRGSERWKSLDDNSRYCFYDSLRDAYPFINGRKIMYMYGRRNFYDIPSVIPQIDRGIEIFEKQGVDPFYAQAILLIESPGKLAKSNVGAYGPFQLMKSVAIRHGLKVNKKIDERADFDLSAKAASSLIYKVCIPYTNAMLKKYNISICESDLWYRLLVLHVYHAGAGNVSRALAVIQPEAGNMDLIRQLWTTSAGGFQNASQNYSQVAIASILELDSIINKQYSNVKISY